MFVPPRYAETEAPTAIASSRSFAEALRSLGMCPSGGGHAVLRNWARREAAVQPAARRDRGEQPVAVGRKYGVSDNAIRKWIRAYQREEVLRSAREHEAVAQRGDDGVGRVALGDDRADAVDPLDHAAGLVAGQGADDGEERVRGGRVDAGDLVAVERRQPEVEDDRVGLELGGHADRFVPVGGRSHYVEARVGEDGPGQEPEARGVVAD